MNSVPRQSCRMPKRIFSKAVTGVPGAGWGVAARVSGGEIG